MFLRNFFNTYVFHVLKIGVNGNDTIHVPNVFEPMFNTLLIGSPAFAQKAGMSDREDRLYSDYEP